MAVFALLAGVTTPAGAAVGETQRASVSTAGAQANGPSPAASVSDTSSPQLSLDGLKVAFSSDATNLVSGDTNGAADVFVRDIVTGRTERVSVSSAGAQANGASHSPAISVDGRFVAFVSQATNLVSGDTNGVADIFLRDRTRGVTTRVSMTTAGGQLNGPSRSPRLSLFGRHIVYETDGVFASWDQNGLSDILLYDTVRASTGVTRAPADTSAQTLLGTEHPDPTAALRRSWSAWPSISHDGRYVAFVRGTYERAPAVPSSLDVFIHDRVARTYTKVVMSPWMGAARVLTDRPMISADGRFVAYEAWSVLDNVARSDEGLVRNPLDVKDIFVYDRIAKTIGQVTFNSWFQPANGDSHTPSISAGGQYISFVSDATNLVSGDTNGAPDVFVRDNVARTTSRMSVGSRASQASSGGIAPSISYEGRRVAFASAAGGLVSGDGNDDMDVFVHDRRTDLLNRAPDFRSLGTRTISPLSETRAQLRASDPDRDPLRFGILLLTHQNEPPAVTDDGLPMNATLDPVTGLFRWTPTPDQAGSWRFIFWVDDPRGAADFLVWDVVVRTLDQLAACTAQGGC